MAASSSSSSKAGRAIRSKVRPSGDARAFRLSHQRETLKWLEQGRIVPTKTLAQARKAVQVHAQPAKPAKQQDPAGPATVYRVVDQDCLEAAAGLAADSDKDVPVVLCNANEFNPGGGYLKGANGQEESICRRSNLAECLAGAAYPIPEFGAVYVPDLFVVKGPEAAGYQTLSPAPRYACVAAAAYASPPCDAGGLTPKYAELTRRKVHAILRVCAAHGHRRLVLGAWGCGAFANPVESIAELFAEVLHSRQYRGLFAEVVFAIVRNKKAVRVFQAALARHAAPDGS